MKYNKTCSIQSKWYINTIQ